ncbi:thioredoxin fold domain-containing protein [Pantoea sp. KXB25]|uniref:thioredoxin fold domain-containing protein n=1 Tax=unclassified Pantoea TaxID=2630326 RepID=UPI003AB42646
MTVLRREGLFVAEIAGGLLSARRYVTQDEAKSDEKPFISIEASAPIFVIPVRQTPWFVVHGDGLYAQNAHDALTPLYRGEDAAQLLRCITDLLTTVESKFSIRRILRDYGHGIASAFLAAILVVGASFAYDAYTSSSTHLLTTVDAHPVFHPETGIARFTPTEPAGVPRMPAPGMRTDSPTGTSEQTPASVPADGWSLPVSVRAELPARLSKAASRGLFTVPLSSGHARTIYVFADPACPNCQRMERHIETAAGTVNVVIFPVTIEGREDSLKTLTPVMALPEAERPAAWKRLFAADTGVGVPGSTAVSPAVSDENQAETARGAIGVNEVAFRAYRLPGTPWTISDDGRYVPQSVLSSPAALTDFLNGGGHDGQ